MITATVTFDEHEIHFNGYIISEAQDGSVWFVQDDDLNTLCEFKMIEQAILYCMENSNG